MHKVKKFKIGRRLGVGVFEKCQTPAFVKAQERRARPKGRRRRPTDFGIALLNKQRVRFMYGVSEKQFSNYVKKAIATKKPADALFVSIEKRLDNVVYRMGIAKTRRMARQMTTHGHFTINGKRLDVPSYSVKEGDVIAVREGSKKSHMFLEIGETLKSHKMPNWLTFDAKTLSGKVTGSPTEPDAFLNFQGVIEFYSR